MNLRTIYKKVKKHPEIADNTILCAALYAASENKALKNTACKDLILAFSEHLLKKDTLNDCEEYLSSYFSKKPPSDKLLHLSRDCLLAGLLYYLSLENADFSPAHSIFLKIDRCDYDALFKRYSEVHRILCGRNCFHYRITDEEGQRYIRELVYRYAQSHRITEKNAAGLLTEEDLRFKRQRIKYFYGGLLIFLTALFWTFLILYCGVLPFLFLAIPGFMLAYEIIQIVASFFLKTAPVLKIKKNSEEATVLTVITSILTSEKDADKLVKKLYKMRRMNRNGAHLFGLLLDFPEGTQPEFDGEKALIDYLVKKINELNKKENCFLLFIRKRSYLSKEQKYLGWERKRGALIQLARLSRGMDENAFSALIADPNKLKSAKYILTLDADTELRFDAVDCMMRAMLHPYNKPIVKNGIVISGYGILQPRIVTGVDSFGRSPFSVLFSGSGGIDSYQNTVFDFYQCVFGKTAFCGKGIFDIDVFLETVDGKFPENRILSHDILEGTRMRCGAMTELALTDSTPATALSYYKRQHRWLRGDYQNILFLLPRLPDGTVNPIDKVSLFMLFMNVIRGITPIFSLASLFFATPMTESKCFVFLTFSFSYMLFPLLYTVLRTARYIGRQFYSPALQNVWQSVCQTAFTLSALSFTSFLSADALIKALYRSLISEKKLLEWVTADQSERKNKNKKGAALLGIYFKKTFLSTTVGLLMLFFSHGGFIRMFGLSFVLFPLVSYLISRPFKQREPTFKDQTTVLRYAKDSFNFFDQFVTEKERYLPPDNFQEIPDETIAHRTSPTNIGLYLSSLVVAYDLGFIREKELLRRLSLTIDSTLSLPKYSGHLYNWYNTQTGEILGTPYISSVDSGNFVISLIAVKEAIKDLPDSAHLVKKIEQMICDTNFSFLYDPKKKLLSIGYDPIKEERSENCYDLYASEARSSYIFAIAKGQIPIESWAKLFRPITVKNGYIGILSWSGTAFEYFMPSLFFPIYRNTLQYELLCFAMSIQMEERYGGIWGKSESCYFQFDGSMNYQYRAFGSPVLALDKEAKQHDVISPYSSFLMFALENHYPLNNLKHLEKAGAYGRYGFYDAVDFTPSRVGKGYAVIRCYMSHHIGMSLIAADNALTNGIFRKRVMSDPDIAAVGELLTERIPADTPKAQIISRENSRAFRIEFPSIGEHLHQNEWRHSQFALIRGTKMSVIVSEDGYVGLCCKNRLITPPYTAKERFQIRYTKQNGTQDVLLKNSRLFCKEEQIRLENEECLLIFGRSGGSITMNIQMKKAEEGESVEIETPILLCSENEYQTHPAFQQLSVEAEYLDHTLIFSKRSGSKNQDVCSFSCTASSENILYRTSADQELSIPHDRTFCRAPKLTVSERITTTGPYTISFRFALAENKSEIKKILYEKEESRKTCKANKEEYALIDYSALLLKVVLSKGRLKKETEGYRIEELWRYGISGDYPIILLRINEQRPSERLLKMVSRLVRTQYRLYCAGIKSDLVFLCKEQEHYFHPMKNALMNTIKDGCGSAIYKKDGGVHLIQDAHANELLLAFAHAFAVLDEDSIFERVAKELESHLEDRFFPEGPLKVSERTFQMNDRSVTLTGGEKNDIPWSYIYCNREFGTLLTDKSLGFTWYRNAGELRLTPFSGKEEETPVGELLLWKYQGESIDLIKNADSVTFYADHAVYNGKLREINYQISVTVDQNLDVKVVMAAFFNHGEKCEPTVEYRLRPCIHRLDDGKVSKKQIEDTLFYSRTVFYNNMRVTAYLTEPEKRITIKKGERKEIFFLFGCYEQGKDRNYYQVRKEFATLSLVKKAMDPHPVESVFRVESGMPEIDLFFNHYLIEQIKKSRLYGRTGYSQPGGAYGFRDQLQDAVNLLSVDESILYKQILLAAEHQFTKGDVQHWWHPLDEDQLLGDAGVRTECSDDLLFLVYCCAEYLEKTGMTEILDEMIGYLEAPPLKEGEERFERPLRSQKKESLYLHCVRALDLALDRRSDTGLAFIGSCDWNDGFSAIRGTSVWLTQFLCLTLQKFLPYCKKEEKIRYTSELPKLREAIEKEFCENRYLRAYFSNGEPLGKESCAYCKIDLLSQAFAVFIEKNARSAIAMNTAYQKLFDEELLLFRLFAPAYDHEENFPGYLGGYCPGFRENGGQYTHAAIWGAKALFMLNENEKAMKVLLGSNPLYRQKRWGKQYALEPYSIAGDIYYAKGEKGRGGWSQYTGAAGWYYSVLLEDLIGYNQSEKYFTLSPHLSKTLPCLRFFINKRDTQYTIEMSLGEKNILLLDERPAENRFFFDKGRHIIKLVLAKSQNM